ncbi:MAG: hypothetical protein H0W87_09640 [Actinobacteria bacterium]|nr:hypothetical protein [Actinomycetota bacterium]
MRRLVVAVLLAALSVTAAASGATKSASACKPGVHTVGKTTYRVFCGPASATVRMGGKTQSFRNGSCLKVGITRVFTISIGTLTISKGKARYSYLGITVPSANHDGVYTRAIIAWAFGGTRYALYNVKLRLMGNRTRGTFSGRVVGKRGTVSGSFRCK